MSPTQPPTSPTNHNADASSRFGALRALIGIVEVVLAGDSVELTLSQIRALLLLAEHGAQRSIDLATAIGIDPSTASRLCARLESRRLVTARRSLQSRRELQIAITAEGHRVLDKVLRDGLERVRAHFPDLDRVSTILDAS